MTRRKNRPSNRRQASIGSDSAMEEMRRLLMQATGISFDRDIDVYNAVRALSLDESIDFDGISMSNIPFGIGLGRGPEVASVGSELPLAKRSKQTSQPGGERTGSSVANRSREKEIGYSFSHVALEDWREMLEQRIDCYPRHISSEARRFSVLSIEDLKLYSEVVLTGTLVTRDKCRHPVFVNFSNQISKIAGCNCSASDGQRPCVHSYLFMQSLLRQSANRGSEFAKFLAKDQVVEGKPNWDDFNYCPTQDLRRRLIALPLPAIPNDDDDHSQLEPIAVSDGSRICWEVIIADDVDIFPRIQQLKKRGDGWLKGKRVSINEVRKTSGIANDRDTEIINLFELDTDYYYPQWTVDVLAALSKLEGADNVMFDGRPVQVLPLDMTLCVASVGDHVGYRPVQLVGKNDFELLRHGDGFVAVMRDEDKIYFSLSGSKRADVLEQLLEFHQCPVELHDELLQKLKNYRNLISVQLPEGEGGEIAAVPISPVVILRSRADGALDYGLRTRLPDGKLLTPGQGALMLHKTDGKEPIQWQRDFGVETKEANRLLQELRLPVQQYNGTIRDFEVAIGLIDQLQSREAGSLEVLWDKHTVAPIKVLGSISSKNVQVGVKAKRDWFQVSGKCQFAGETVDLNAILACMADTDVTATGYVKVGEQGWAKISDELRSQLLALREATSQDRNTLKLDATSAPAIRQLMAGQIAVDSDKKWAACLKRLERSEKLEPKLPTGLQAKLRDYQVEGYKWLRRLAEWGVGGVLADDMGLGKTLQTLAVLLDRKKHGPALVIAPTSVAFNWKREAEKFAPQLNVHSYRETDRSEFLETLGANDLVVCSYGLALRDAAQLAEVEWSTLVLDEAQAVKNSRSKTSAAIAAIPADWRLALTGTPVENHLGELWSLFHVVSPGVFGGWENFRRRFATPIEKENDESRRLALRDRLRPFILRRTKSEVLTDLPPRSESNIYIELSAAERAAYEAVRRSAIGEIDEIANLPNIQDQRFRLLALLTRLRQLACSPKLVHENWAERSSKLTTLLETVEELQREGHRVLVFSQFVQHLTLIREMFEQSDISFEYLDGSTPAAERQNRVDRFQNGDATVFLISLKAGGTGLNLTAADYVIHMDPWWNPAVEDQATDRAHRIGQDKPVMVYRMISEGTIEEEILRLHETKRDLVAGLMEGAQASAKMSTEELIRLVRG